MGAAEARKPLPHGRGSRFKCLGDRRDHGSSLPGEAGVSRLAVFVGLAYTNSKLVAKRESD